MDDFESREREPLTRDEVLISSKDLELNRLENPRLENPRLEINPLESGSTLGKIEGSRGGIVTARGTADGLVVRLDGRVDSSSLKEALLEFLNSRKGFLSGNEVALEWVGTLPHSALIGEISALLLSEFNITVRSSALWEQPSRTLSINIEDDIGANRVLASIPGGRDSSKDSSSTSYAKGIKSLRGTAQGGRAPSLFDGIEVFSSSVGEDPLFKNEAPERCATARVGTASERAASSFDPTLWDDPDCRVLYGTIRSGQKIETEHSLVVFGDVNSGAELIAGGDIVVLGNLRGIAHAGAYDETGGGRVIFALNLQPTQLRIGMTISRGSSESGSVPEVARVEGNLIVVEPYTSRANVARRK